MNDLSLITRHGPAATGLSPEVRSHARAALVAEISQTRRVAPQHRRVRLVAAAAAVVGGALVLPSFLGTGGSSAVALGPAAPLTFPFTATHLPDGLGAAVFERDPGFQAARYGSVLNGITITTEVDDADHWPIAAQAATVDLDGQTATVVTGQVHAGSAASAPAVTVVWQTSEHGWTAVRGSGEYAEVAQVEAVAESLTDVAQPVRLSLEVAPQGWTVAAYQADRVLTLSPDGEVGPDGLTVTLEETFDPVLAGTGARDVTPATLHGATASVGRINGGTDIWIVAGRTASGQAFALQAPADRFTRDQVVQVAAGVSYQS